MMTTARLSAEERRIQILEIAIDVFAEKGFSGARTKEMAKRAGISETLIYQHFESKDALYQAALEYMCSGHPMEDDMRVPMEQSDDETLFHNMALHMLTHLRNDPRIVRMHLYQALDDNPSSFLETHKEDEHVAMLAKYIQSRMDAGVFTKGNAHFMSKLFHYAVFMAIADRQLGLIGGQQDLNDDDLATALTTQILDGFRTR